MCDPATLALMAVTIGSTLIAGSGKKEGDTIVNTPPAAEAPAIAAPTARVAGADVRLGRKTTKRTEEATGDRAKFKEKRTKGVALGGLGRSGMGL
jgi:hypothetical protein